MDSTETSLLEAARAGDGAAVDKLLERHEKQVLRFGLRICGTEDDAREVLQDTLFAAFRTLPDFRGDAALSTWLFQIARSFCARRRRRGAFEPETLMPLDHPDAAAVPSAGAPPDAAAHAREIGRVLEQAISALPESHREVIVLRDVEGLSAEEAADVLGLEVGALKSRLHRARSTLRRRLGELLGEAAAGRRRVAHSA